MIPQINHHLPLEGQDTNQIDAQYNNELILASSKIHPTISILTASLNEVNNIELWLKGIKGLLEKGMLNQVIEIVIVDDGSNDGTVSKIISMEDNYPVQIKLIQRHRRMGTLDSQITGALQCKSDYLLVMDCDLQHPIQLIPNLTKSLNMNPDIIIGSRYIKGGGNNWNPYRGIVSRTATLIAHILLRKTRKIKDPLSGYFIIRTELLRNLKPHEGMFKLLIYAITMNESLKIIEVPVSMVDRSYGKSKVVNNPIKVTIRYIREVLVFWINGKKMNKKR